MPTGRFRIEELPVNLKQGKVFKASISAGMYYVWNALATALSRKVVTLTITGRIMNPTNRSYSTEDRLRQMLRLPQWTDQLRKGVGVGKTKEQNQWNFFYWRKERGCVRRAGRVRSLVTGFSPNMQRNPPWSVCQDSNRHHARPAVYRQGRQVPWAEEEECGFWRKRYN